MERNNSIGAYNPKEHQLQFDDQGQVIRKLSVEELLKQKAAYEYLTHLEEVKQWMKKVDVNIIPDGLSVIEFEDNLRNGVALAKLCVAISPEEFHTKIVYDPNYERFTKKGLEFRHIENIGTLRRFYKYHGLPEIIYPSATDIYDKKNMPSGIYSLHAIAILLYKKGILKFGIENLMGKINFKQEEIDKIQSELDKLGISLPEFGKINGIIANEIKIDEAERLAGIIKINESIENQNSESLLENLKNPNVEINNIFEELIDSYLTVLNLNRNQKIENNRSILESTSHEDLDYFMKNLTLEEIQQTLNDTNFENLLKSIDKAISDQNMVDLMRLLSNPSLELHRTLIEEHAKFYLDSLTESRNHQKEYFNKTGEYFLDKRMIQDAISDAFEKADRMIKLNNAVNLVNQTIRDYNLDNFKSSIESPILEIENLINEQLSAYLDDLHKKYNDEKSFFSKKDLQNIINNVNGAFENEKKVNNLLHQIADDAKQGDRESFENHLKSSLLNLDYSSKNIDLYIEYINENPENVNSIESLAQMIKKADEVYKEAENLALAMISLSQNSSSVDTVKTFLKSDITQINEVDDQIFEQYSESISEFLENIRKNEMKKENEHLRQMDTGFFKGNLKNGKTFYYDEELNVVYWSIDQVKEVKQEDLTRISLNQVQEIVNKSNAFQNVVKKAGDIDSLQNIIHSMMTYHHYHRRFLHFKGHKDDIESIQTFLMNLVKKGDWNDLMSGKLVKLPTIAKFVNILMPTDHELKNIKDHLELRQKVRKLIIEFKKNTEIVQELDVSLGLLVQSNYSEKYKHKRVETNALPFTDMRMERAETLHKYGSILFWLHSRPKYLANLLHATDESENVSIENILLSIYNYLSTQQEEARALKCCKIAISNRLECEGGLEYLSTGNPQTIRCTILLMRHIESSKLDPFLKSFSPVIDEILSESDMNYSLDPLVTYLSVVKDKHPIDLTEQKALENLDVASKIQEDIVVYKKYAAKIVDSFCNSYAKIPFFIRSLIRFIFELPNFNKKEKRKICGNILFNKFLAPMITSPDSFEMTSKKSENIKEKQRKFLSDLSQIVYAISIGRGFNELYLEDFNDFIAENNLKIREAYKKIIDIPKDEEFYQISHRSDFAVDTDSVTIKIEELIKLHKLLLENEDKIANKKDDMLLKSLANFRNPHIDNFLRDTSIDHVSKAEMAYRHIVILLVPELKSGSGKEITNKHKMKNLKLLVCQLLFAVNRSVYLPAEIDDLMAHEWTEIEVKTHESNVAIIKEVAAQSTTTEKSEQMKLLIQSLEDIKSQCMTYLAELVEAKELSKEDSYQVLIDNIATDIRNEHARKIENQRERTTLLKTLEDVEAKNSRVLEKIKFVENYIHSLKQNISTSKSNKRKSIFSSKSGKGKKPKDYSVDSLLKQGVIETADPSSYGSVTKNLQIKVVPLQEDQFEFQLNVSGKKVEQTPISIENVLLSIYKSNKSRELFKGLIFNNQLLYQKLLKDN